MAPKIVDKEKRKREIAMVALKVFSEEGLEKTTIARVAKEAGIGKGTIYEYFESKDELIYGAMIAWAEMIESVSAHVIEGIEDPVERLLTYARQATTTFVQDDTVAKLGLDIMKLLLDDQGPHKKYSVIRDASRAYKKVLMNILLDGVSIGVFRPEIARDAEKIAINIFAFLDGIAFHWLMDKDYFDIAEQVDYHMRNMILALQKSKTETETGKTDVDSSGKGE